MKEKPMVVAIDCLPADNTGHLLHLYKYFLFYLKYS